MRKIKKGDTVKVIAGNSKGQIGKILQVIETGAGKYSKCKVLVDSVNMVTHYVKANPQKEDKGGLIKREAPIDRSNVTLIDGNNKASKVGIRSENGDNVRFFKSTNEIVGA